VRGIFKDQPILKFLSHLLRPIYTTQSGQPNQS
jgi:hypothetical protein